MSEDGVPLENGTNTASVPCEVQIPLLVEYEEEGKDEEEEQDQEHHIDDVNQIKIKEIASSKFVPYHPGLLDLDSLQKTQDLQYSTHLPFVTGLPLKKGRVLKLLSWNVELQAVNLFGPVKRALTFEAVPEVAGFFDSLAMTQRQRRIAQSLQKMVKKQKPDLILLQKIDIDQALLTMLKMAWSKNYSFVEDASHQSNIAFYRNEKVLKARSQNIPDRLDYNEHCIVLKSGETVRIRNTHSMFTPNPQQYEKEITDYLNTRPEGELRVVAGNLSCPLSMLPSSPPQLTASNTEAIELNDGSKVQLAQYTDGVFYKDINTKKIHQAKTVFLNPMIGKPFSRHELQKFPKQVHELQDKLFSQLRPALHIDASFYTTKLLNNNQQTILEMELYLRERWYSQEIGLRFGSNLYNDHGFSLLGVSEHQCLLIRKYFPATSFQYEQYTQNNGTESYIISAYEEDSLLFIKALNALPLLTMLPTLETKSNEIHDAVHNLVDAIVKDNNIDVMQSTDIYNHFIEPISAVIDNRMPNFTVTEKTQQKMTTALRHGSKATHVAAYLAIGAIGGFMVGLSVASGLLFGLGFGVGLLIGLGAVAVFASEISLAGAAVAGVLGHKIETTHTAPSKSFQRCYKKAASSFHTFFQPQEKKQVPKQEIEALYTPVRKARNPFD